MKPIIILPSYNTALYLPRILPEIKAHIPNVFVVDDGSTDQTSMVAQEQGATVICHPHNRGKGAALKTGFAHALKEGFDPILTMDSDGQHKPIYIPDFLEAYAQTGADLIIGSRKNDKADMPWERRFSNWATSSILSFLLDRRIEDSQCGFRLHSRRLLESLRLESDKYEIETEIIIKAVKAKFNVKFIPVKVEYGFGFPTHINRVADTLRWCRKVLDLI